jgi:RNA polymerase sigma-70 factor (ECF subfamily)
VPLAEIDNRIVRKAQRGDPHAFAVIVRTYQVPVFNYVLRTVGDRGLAEDLTQEVFLRVFQSLPKFSFRSKFTTWLFQVTRNRMLDELRARERRPRCIELDAVHTLSVVDAPAEQAETIEALWRAVDRLSLDLKMALLLRDIAGFSYNEIAEILEITLATVKWRIHKAREEVHLMLTRPEALTTRRAEDTSARRLRTADGAAR